MACCKGADRQSSTALGVRLKEYMNGREVVRATCEECALKHLSQAELLACQLLGEAEILWSESRQGYAHHIWMVLGHMAQAADELLETRPEMANEIRSHRIKMQDTRHDPAGFYRPPFGKLIEALDGTIGLELR